MVPATAPRIRPKVNPRLDCLAATFALSFFDPSDNFFGNREAGFDSSAEAFGVGEGIVEVVDEHLDGVESGVGSAESFIEIAKQEHDLDANCYDN